MELCEFCNEDVSGDSTAIEMEDGTYHEECYEEYVDGEQSYWAGQYYASKPTASAEGYDWGDPKNPEYVEHVLDNTDTI